MDLWDSFVAKEDMNMIDSLHLRGKGAVIFAAGLKRTALDVFLYLTLEQGD